MRAVDYRTLKRNLRVSYDNHADERADMTDTDWKRAERARFAERLRGAGASTVLELGAGHGVSGRALADLGFAVTCVDLSPELVAHCRAAGLDAHVMDFSALTFDDDAFDAAFAMNCLLHVPSTELDGVLRGVARVLKPGGLFYWGQYGGRDFEGVWDKDRYEPRRFFNFMTAERAEAIAAAHFTVVDFHITPLDRFPPEFHGLLLRSA
jgi:SAM-dependent methyltransferase